MPHAQAITSLQLLLSYWGLLKGWPSTLSRSQEDRFPSGILPLEMQDVGIEF